MKLKICGQKHNIGDMVEFQPDYLGFIFWEPSSRYFKGERSKLPEGVKKVGVFVDAPIQEVLEKVEKYALDGVQLHGDEKPAYCKKLREEFQQHFNQNIDIIKVFSIKDTFDFSALTPYERVCDYYLFDTKGKLPGGNGYTFDWSVLEGYPSTKPYFLSGGIGLEHVGSIKSFLKRKEAKYCHAIDINSRFEIEPGLKNTETIKEFKALLNHELSR